jgi:hypothetical protein
MDEIELRRRLRYEGGLWVARIAVEGRTLEIILDGSPEAPDPGHLHAISSFLPVAGPTIARLRRKLRFAWLYRPIRVAPNMQSRVGVQFKNWLNGVQTKMYFADEA